MLLGVLKEMRSSSDFSLLKALQCLVEVQSAIRVEYIGGVIVVIWRDNCIVADIVISIVSVRVHAEIVIIMIYEPPIFDEQIIIASIVHINPMASVVVARIIVWSTHKVHLLGRTVETMEVREWVTVVLDIIGAHVVIAVVKVLVAIEDLLIELEELSLLM